MHHSQRKFCFPTAKAKHLLLMICRVEDSPDGFVSCRPALLDLRDECGFPVHGGGDAHLPQGAGQCPGQRHVHGLSNGLTLHRVLGKNNRKSRIFEYNIVIQSVISEKAPFLIISFLCMLGAIPGLLLPETADLKMPDSLEDIKEFGRHDRLFWMPLCKSRRRFRKSLQTEFNNISLSPSSVENKGFAL